MSVLAVLLVMAAAPVRFSGSTDISVEQGPSAGVLSDSNLVATFSLRPALTFSSISLKLDVLLSSQDSKVRQAVDRFRLSLQPEQLERPTASPPSFFTSIKDIELGACTPTYSPFILSGIPVFGAAVELNPGPVYLAATVGRIQRAIEGIQGSVPAYSRMLYAGRLGFGKREATHFYVNLLHARDDPNSINKGVWPGDSLLPPDSLRDSFQLVKPVENTVLGAELNLSLFQRAFTLQSEISGSGLIPISPPPVINDSGLFRRAFTVQSEISDTDQFLGSLFHIGDLGFASAIKPAVNVFDTRLYGEFRIVWPGYQSLGAPYLRDDDFSLSAGIERSFFNNSVSASATYSRERDKLNAPRFDTLEFDTIKVDTVKVDTAIFTSYSFDLGLAFPNLPYVQLSYSPYSNVSDALSSHADVASLSAGYRFVAGGLSHSPSLLLSFDQISNHPGNDYATEDLGLGYSLGFKFPLSISASTRLSQIVYRDSVEHRLHFCAGPSYTLFGKWTNRLSWSGSYDATSSRHDIELRSSFPIWKIADASLRVERSFYHLAADGKGWCLSARLSKSW